MAEVVCDLLERYTFDQQTSGAGVPESVRPIAWQNKPELMKTLAYHRAESGAVRVRCGWTHVRKISRSLHFGRTSRSIEGLLRLLRARADSADSRVASVGGYK
jgi:hypothetical protein